MRELLGVIFLIIGGALVTIHFALGIPFFIGTILLWHNRRINTDSYLAIMGPLMLNSIILVWLVALFD